MRVITAPNRLEFLGKSVFLAGGITDCEWWQDELISLIPKSLDVTLLNPRRRDFPIGDPSAAQEQIGWEFAALELASIFSIWFSGGRSPQPICMYELGRHVAKREVGGKLDRVAVGVDPSYIRKQDVEIQLGLVSKALRSSIAYSLSDHCENIVKKVRKMEVF